jgi:UDP-N-acetyl-D-mannosaminuronate dehydrogenase
MKLSFSILLIFALSYSVKSQVLSLDSSQAVKVLQAFNDLKLFKSLDTINRAQIETLNESVELYSISLETCEKQADNYELIILATDEELIQTKNALRTESRRAKLFKVGLILIPIAFVFGLVI